VSDVRACRACLTAPQGPPLPHEPRPVLRARATAMIVICGQAPGARVHASGIPFTDPSGDRLQSWMGIGPTQFYDEDRVAFLPMGFCYPGNDGKGGDLPPRRQCAPLWRTQLLAGLPRLELMLLVGSYAQRWHLPDRRGAPMGAVVASWRQCLDAPSQPVPMLPLPHPSWRNTSWINKNPWFEAEVLPELQARIRKIFSISP
jgi:uracil-DNA glycosylase